MSTSREFHFNPWIRENIYFFFSLLAIHSRWRSLWMHFFFGTKKCRERVHISCLYAAMCGEKLKDEEKLSLVACCASKSWERASEKVNLTQSWLSIFHCDRATWLSVKFYAALDIWSARKSLSHSTFPRLALKPRLLWGFQETFLSLIQRSHCDHAASWLAAGSENFPHTKL